MNVLVTGGAGYIGSHTVVELLGADHNVVVLDNFRNSSATVVKRIEGITGKTVTFEKGDVCDKACLDRLFTKYDIDSVIHAAGLKAVGESVGNPLAYYENNVFGTLNLCQSMATAGVYRLIFSSSATVYGFEAEVPYQEDMIRGTTANPYGASKAMTEKILEDLCKADERWAVTLLRYFNPIGAHPSGQIGEAPQGTPNNLMPFISQVAVGHLKELSIFGNDYPTEDGTCIRDYVHVVDLAKGHLKALEKLNKPGVHIYNLGTGDGYSVLQIVNSFERVTAVKIPFRFSPQRKGDLPAIWADVNKVKDELGWSAQLGLDEMIRDTWHWQSNNPKGFQEQIT